MILERKRNRAYHSFFEGYTEYYDVRPNGKKIICRIYTGSLYVQNRSKNRRILDRLMYVAAFFLSAVFFGLSAIQPTSSEISLFAAIPTAIAVFLYLWLFVAMIYYLPIKPRTIYAYHTSRDGLLRSSLSLAICHGLSVVMYLLHTVMNKFFSVSEGKTILFLFFSALFVLYLFCAERRCPYLETHATEDIIEGTYIQ